MPLDDPRSDQQLLDAAGEGDDAAFATLYYRHRDSTLRLARRFGATEADALDILQDTFSYLLRKLPGLRLTGRLTTLLYPVVKNLTLARRRKSARERPDDDALSRLPAPVWHRFSTGDVTESSLGGRDLSLLASAGQADIPRGRGSRQADDPGSANVSFVPVADGAPADRELEGPSADSTRPTDLGDLATVLSILPAPQRETIILRFVDGFSLEEIAAALNIPLGTVKSRLHHALAALRTDPRTRAYFDQPV